MKKLTPLFATLSTPPTLMINIYSAVVEQINIIVILAVSVVTLVFWVISIKNKKLERQKNEADRKAAEAKAEYYRQLTKGIIKK